MSSTLRLRSAGYARHSLFKNQCSPRVLNKSISVPSVISRGDSTSAADALCSSSSPSAPPLPGSNSASAGTTGTASLSSSSGVPTHPSNLSSQAQTQTQNSADANGDGCGVGNGRTRSRARQTPQRPDISNAHPRKWNRPLAEGVLPVYDLALNLIRGDSFRLRREAAKARREVLELDEKKKKSTGEEGEVKVEEKLTEKVEEARKRLRTLEVQSLVNLPEVRWRVANAMEDMQKPIHRHLMEQRWRKDGDLDLLMERLHQMKVIPDVLPDLHPTIDVHVSARTTYKDMRRTGKKHSTVEPGSFLSPEQTLEPPHLHVNVFHTDTRLYTLLLVDPDVPDVETSSFTTFLHWLKPNIPLSATHRERLKDLNDHTPYIPPHPQRGSKYHRYVLLMIPQPPLDTYNNIYSSGDGTSSEVAMASETSYRYPLTTEARAAVGEVTSQRLDDIPPVIDPADRSGFDVRAFVRRWGLHGQGAGAHMWRELWDPTVSRLYRNLLKEAEPRYGFPKKPDRYAEVRNLKRYI